MADLSVLSNTLQVLEKYNFNFQKKYGQNFLIDSHILDAILDGAEITKDDCVLEIGPGIGTMTQRLCGRARFVIAVEIDKNLIPILNDTLSEYDNKLIINEDVLKVDIKELCEKYNEGKPIKVVANLPYYITTPIIMGLFESRVPLNSITVMVQKEVADRMKVGPGTKDYGALSLAVQFYSKPEVILNVSANCFIPRPNVDSAVIKLSLLTEKIPVEDEAFMFALIRASFNQRRKTLVNGLTNAGINGVTKEAVLKAIKEMDPDIIVVAAYGKILPKEILQIPKFGCINVHASLLPRYRGSAPIQHAILEGEEVTGVTIMQMAEGMDTGDMISKVTVPVGSKNCEQLHDELAEAGAGLLIRTMNDIENGSAVHEKQDDSLATYAPMIRKKDGLINFSASAVSIERKIRAFYPWPGSFTQLNGQMFKIWKASVETDKTNSGGHVPGTVISADNEGIRVSTGEGILRLIEVQTPGKRRMTAEDWLKGNSIEINTVLG